MGNRVGAAALAKDPGIRRVKIRGEVYTLRELTIGEFDEINEKAKERRVNPLTDREEDVVNNTTLMRLMVAKSSGISIAKQADLPTPVVITLNALVNEMHFPATDGKDKLWEPVDEEGDEEGQGEG